MTERDRNGVRTAAATVLLIDADPDNAEICSTFLRHHGYEVLVAEDPETGVELAGTVRPAVVITELFRRTPTSWWVIEALASRPATAAIPLIVLSARALAEDRQAARGATIFLPKPLSLQEVLDQVRRLAGAEPGAR